MFCDDSFGYQYQYLRSTPARRSFCDDDFCRKSKITKNNKLSPGQIKRILNKKKAQIQHSYVNSRWFSSCRQAASRWQNGVFFVATAVRIAKTDGIIPCTTRMSLFGTWPPNNDTWIFTNGSYLPPHFWEFLLTPEEIDQIWLSLFM